MGQTLSEPVTTKESSYCQNSQFRVIIYLFILMQRVTLVMGHRFFEKHGTGF